MKIKQVYIAASWKHRHAVEMLTFFLVRMDIKVVSFVARAVETEGEDLKHFDIDKWISSEDGMEKYVYDTEGAMTSDLVVYIGPSGKDAAAECGMASARGVPLVGLFAKGEDFGLMRLMFTEWYDDVWSLLDMIEEETGTPWGRRPYYRDAKPESETEGA